MRFTDRRVVKGAAALATAVALAAAVTASAGGHSSYVVKPGDTLSSIASHYGTTVNRLVKLNHLPAGGNLIYAGSRLRLPGSHSGVHHAGHRTGTYVVHAGDTLYGIADKFHEPWQRIARRNHLPSSLVVVIGQRLRVERPAHHGGHHTSHRHLSSGPAPSRARMEGIVRRTAIRWGVDPHLALAISYEEAGFNQRMVSSVGAIGAMQIMPATARWLSTSVVHRPLDVHRAHDNATAGVAMLDVLLRSTGGNVRQAVAGYYQGLASVRARGMYDDTKQYVANVLALRNRF